MTHWTESVADLNHSVNTLCSRQTPNFLPQLCPAISFTPKVCVRLYKKILCGSKLNVAVIVDLYDIQIWAQLVKCCIKRYVSFDHFGGKYNRSDWIEKQERRHMFFNELFLHDRGIKQDMPCLMTKLRFEKRLVT